MVALGHRPTESGSAPLTSAPPTPDTAGLGAATNSAATNGAVTNGVTTNSAASTNRLATGNAAVRPYLVGLDLDGQQLLVVGGGAFALDKIKTLRDSGATVVVIAPKIDVGIRALVESGQVVWKRRRFRVTDPRNCRLVIVAVGDDKAALRIRTWCKRWRVLVNVVDSPGACDVIIPSVARCGPATIAVSTGGTTPAGARFLREEIERTLSPRLGEILHSAGKARATLRYTGRYRMDYAVWEKDFFEAALSEGENRCPESFREDFVRDF